MCPLKGMQVIELAGLGPAPMACMMLAEVIRIERSTTRLADQQKDVSYRGKKSVAAAHRTARICKARFIRTINRFTARGNIDPASMINRRERPMRARKFPSLFGASLGLAAWLISGGLVARNAFAVPASIDLPGDRVFPENLTSTKTGTLYVGSLGSGGIIRIKPHSAKAELWIKPGAFGSRSIFGVLTTPSADRSFEQTHKVFDRSSVR